MFAIPGRRLVAVLSLAGTIAVIPPGTGAAGADTPVAPTVSITSPTADSTVSGTTSVTASITQPDSAHPVSEVYFQVYGTNGIQTRDVSVAADQCSPTCTISADFDTLTFIPVTNPDPVQALPDLGDGTTEIDATVYTSFGPNVNAREYVTIDNHRPTLSLPDLTPGPDGRDLTGVGSMTTRVQTTLAPGSTAPITGFRLMVPHVPALSLADIPLDAPQDGTGTGVITVPTGDVPPGPYAGYLVAVDADGVASQVVRFGIDVPDPYHLAARVDAVSPTSITLTAVPTWYDRSTPDQTWLQTVSVSSHGTQLATADSFPAPHASATVTVLATSGTPFPDGDNTFTVTAVDNRGVRRSVDVVATTTDPLTETWSQAPVIVAGAPSGIAVDVADSSASGIYSILLSIDGVTASSTTMPLSVPTLIGRVPDPVQLTAGPHTVAATVTLLNGQRFMYHHAVDSYARPVLTLASPTTTVWGSKTTFHGTVSLGRQPQLGVAVQLQSRAPGSPTWVTRQTARTNQAGAVAFALSSSVAGTAAWRTLIVAQGHLLAAASPASAVMVRAAFGATPVTRTVRRNVATGYRLSIAPAQGGVIDTVQVLLPGRSSWSTLTHVATARTGALGFSVRFASPGTYRLRVVTAGTSRVTSATSASWVLRVVR